MENYIGFPGFGLSFNIDPVAFTLFGKDVYWYGVLIASAIILAVIMCTQLAKKQGLTGDNVLDVVLWGAPAGIVCARLYYCAFRFEYYMDNPIDIIKIWEGGLAIYGGIFGAAAAAYAYCHYKKISWKKMFDVCLPGVMLGQAIGRWGNFINREAHGGITNLPWRMELNPLSGEAYHPTFLYESLWNFCGVLFLLWLSKRKSADGEVCFTYFIWYGIGRFFIEGLRTDSLYWGPFRISQVVALLTAVLGLILLIRLKKNNNVKKS